MRIVAPSVVTFGVVLGCGRIGFDPVDVGDGGTGTFPHTACVRSTTMPNAGGDYSVAFGDFDGDGHLDLVTTSYQQLEIGLGDGQGHFGAPTSYAAEGAVKALAVGDLDHDDHLDLVIATTSGQTIQVGLGNGDGTLAPLVSYGYGYGVEHITLADLDRDGTLDALTTSYNDGLLGVRRGSANGTFGSVQETVTGSLPSCALAADLDGDGALDAVAGTVDFTIASFRGDGTGGLQRIGGYGPSLNDAVPAVALADLDGDGVVDAVAGHYVGVIYVLRGTGDGSFDPTMQLPVPGPLAALALVDFDGDRAVDLIAVPSDTAMRARLYRGDGAGAFAAAGDLAIPAGVVADNANAIAVADYDEDGAPDLAIVAGTSISLISNGCLW